MIIADEVWMFASFSLFAVLIFILGSKSFNANSLFLFLFVRMKTYFGECGVNGETGAQSNRIEFDDHVDV